MIIKKVNKFKLSSMNFIKIMIKNNFKKNKVKKQITIKN